MKREEELDQIEALLQQIIRSNVPEEQLLNQLETFEKGIPHTRLLRPCTIGDGIIQVDTKQFPPLIDTFKKAMDSGRVTKFTPASGAASRMFKDLLGYMNACLEKDGGVSDGVLTFGRHFFDHLDKFPFHDALAACIEDKGQSLDALLEEGDHGTVLQYMLTEKGLNYAQLPKGLIPFHKAAEGSRTPFVEHLAEALQYACDKDNKARLHFTVPAEHQQAIETHINEAKNVFQSDTVTWEISFSIQKESSRTLAVDMDNNPVRVQGNLLVFRPAGHGALLENLSDINGDIVFIKNIDNVVPDSIKEETYTYKKVLGGYLVLLQDQIFNSLRKLEKVPCDDAALSTAEKVVSVQLGLPLPDGYRAFSPEEKRTYLFSRLHRPLRICGMVKNVGEPGGGPFWIKEDEGCPLQIVESAQVDMDDSSQKDIFTRSSHFNPVDLVCGLQDHHGRPFNLMHYVDYDLGLISVKSKGGQELKALELPGLWNGSMAYWNTLFIEVPLITFNPVKTINDLLRPEHQA